MQLSIHRNIGTIDRVFRILVGILLIYLIFFGGPVVMGTWLSILLGILGLAMIVEGVLGY